MVVGDEHTDDALVLGALVLGVHRLVTTRGIMAATAHPPSGSGSGPRMAAEQLDAFAHARDAVARSLPMDAGSVLAAPAGAVVDHVDVHNVLARTDPGSEADGAGGRGGVRNRLLHQRCGHRGGARRAREGGVGCSQLLPQQHLDVSSRVVEPAAARRRVNAGSTSLPHAALHRSVWLALLAIDKPRRGPHYAL